MKSKQSDIAERFASKISDTGEAVSDIADEGTDRIKKMFNKTNKEVKNGIKNMQNDFAEYVRENPFLTMSLSLLAGIVIGEIIKR